MKFSFQIISILLICFCILPVAGQIPVLTESAAKEELAIRGLEETQIRAALKSNGFDLDKIEDASPEEILKIQNILEELEAENKKNNVKSVQTEADSIITIKPVLDPIFATDTIKNNPEEKPQDTQIFGHEYINIPIKKSRETFLVNESYLVGSGDVLSISIWSRNAKFDKSFTIDKKGYINLSDASQRIFVKGMQLSDVRVKIKSRLKEFYQFNEGDFNMSLETARNINISIFGEITNSGGYSFAANYNVLDALRLSGGMKENGSIRNIKIIRSDGSSSIFDLYKYIKESVPGSNLFMQDGDIIHVPIAQEIVQMTGAVKRARKFEIIAGEGLRDLIEFAGGFSEDANSRLIQVERFTDEDKLIFDVDYSELVLKDQNFELKNGDIVSVRSIGEQANNFVMIQGAIVNPGRYERFNQMKVADLLELARIKEESKTDFAFLVRKKMDGTSTYIRLNLDNILNDKGDQDNFILNNRDVLTIWAKERFIDDGIFSVGGAIRFPGDYNYDYSEKLYFSDAILLAGGVSRDASNIAVIHRSDPLKPNEKEYVRINLDRLDPSLAGNENLVLQPYDRIEILSKNLFTERTTVQISGPVNNPGEFQYGKKMSLKDLIILAGGFKLGASTRNIEISRVVIRENKSTEITVAKVDFDQNFAKDESTDKNYILEPYDHVKVRYVPEFEFQKDVEIRGQVTFPGIYTLASKNEKVSDLILKAGGLSSEAFSDGATLFRKQDNLGYIVLKLNEVLEDKKSKFNFILKDGDIIDVPKIKDFVTIRGATKANEIYGEKLVKNPNGINVPYHDLKDANYYIHKYTGGLAENASKKEIYVEHPNGEIEKTKTFLFFYNYPKVRKGSVIKVGTKPNVEKVVIKEKKDVDWSKVISDSLAQAMTIFTLILLAKQASN